MAAHQKTGRVCGCWLECGRPCLEREVKRTQTQIAANDAEITVAHIAGSKKAAMPKTIAPMLASLTTEARPERNGRTN